MVDNPGNSELFFFEMVMPVPRTLSSEAAMIGWICAKSEHKKDRGAFASIEQVRSTGFSGELNWHFT